MPVLRRSPARRRGTARAAAAGAAHTPGGGAAETSTPRYLDGAVAIQRQEDAALPEVPHYQLTPPSLLQPRDPYAPYRPDFGFRYRLDPRLEAQALARARVLLAPSRVLPSLAAQAPTVAASGTGATTGASSPPSSQSPSPSPALPTRGAAAGSPSSAPTTPGTTSQAEGPRPGSGGDVLGAVLATPQVAALLEDVQNRFTGGFTRYWNSASLGGQIGFVSSSVVVGGAMLAPMLGFDEPRSFVLPLLNDVVLPVPGLSGYGLEFSFGEHDVMIGAHLDVGRLLPSLWGFGEASFAPIGGPPGSDANALPPLSRKADGEAGEAEAGDVAADLQARRGAGRVLDATTRAELEPALGADLSAVRVHADAQSDALARSLHAQAFTSGRDVFFRAQRYDPHSRDGRRLLAHELTHVAQQARGGVGGRALGGGLRVSAPQDAHEREADRVAGRIVDGDAPRHAPAPLAPAANTTSVQRQPAPSGAKQPVPAAQAQAMAPPLRHRNRLFNEQAAVEMENGRIKRVLPGQESEGVCPYNLPQNESPTRTRAPGRLERFAAVLGLKL